MFQADDATIALLRQRWKAAQHVGERMPWAKAWVRTGKIRRRFEQVPRGEVYSTIPGLDVGARTVWRGRWEAATDYRELPNLREVELTTDFAQNGVTQATITIDTLAAVETTGVAGVYRQFKRGYYAPLRGYRPPGRVEVGEMNDWFDILRDKSTEIVIVAGYGPDAAIPVFKGLLNDNSLVALPDRATITARDFGQLLTDQQVFINAKVRKVRDPITFADRLHSDEVEEVHGSVRASSHEKRHPARHAIDGKNSTAWRSQGHDNKAAFEWIEMSLPAGRYESFRLAPERRGQECYVAFFRQGEWVDAGKGNVPGTSVPYIRRIKQLKGKYATYRLPQSFRVGNNARLRLYFTNLGESFDPDEKANRRRASVREFAALRRRRPQEVRKKQWILVDDAADVVRTVLQWCGLDREWEIEDTGVRLSDKMVFNRSDKLIDIINRVAELTNYVFYMKPPSQFDDEDLTPTNDNNQSLGIPVFRQNQAMRTPNALLEPMEQVTEDDLLEALEPQFSDEPLAYNIRVRGKRLKKKQGGLPLAGDRTRRAMYVYRPPWSRDLNPGGNWPNDAASNQYRNGNVKRYTVHHDEMLRNTEECEIACLFIAFRQALESAKATAEFAAMPTIHLDHQFSIKDEGTGLSARLWLTNRMLRIRLGEDPEFKMSVGGSLLDTPDILIVREELVRALRKKGYDPGLSEWELEHHGWAYKIGGKK